MSEPNVALPDEPSPPVPGIVLPDFCYSDDFTGSLMGYIRSRAWKFSGQLKSLAGHIEAAVPTMEDVIQEVYTETLEGVLKKRDFFAGKPEIEYKKYSFRIARNKLASTMTELNGKNLSDLKRKIVVRLNRERTPLRNVDRLSHPIDSSNDDETYTVESTVTDGGALPYDDRNSEEVQDFMAKEFDAMEGEYPNLGEFHLLIIGRHSACCAGEGKKPKKRKDGTLLWAFTCSQAAAYLNAQYPGHKRDDSTYLRQWVKVMLAVHKKFGYKPTTKPKGQRKNTDDHED